MRIDLYLVHNHNLSRAKAQQMLKEGMILCNGKQLTKASYDVKPSDIVTIDNTFQYASIGGDKLKKAIDDFSYNPHGKVCVDIGASNGGFTDCLLQHGASKVYAVDVGECAFDDRLKSDSRVVVKDRTNARNLTSQDLGEKCDFCCVDVSFISLKYLLPTVFELLKEGGEAICLVKPQFEAGKSNLSKKGIVTDPKVRNRVLQEVCEYAVSLGFSLQGTTTAPIKDKKNIEFLIYIAKIIV
ncbi:MAG: TlyA family RNA methyltransferase [Christensenellales bacterium]